MSCAICGRTVGLNKQYGDLFFCPDHSEKDLPAKEETQTAELQAGKVWEQEQPVEEVDSDNN